MKGKQSEGLISLAQLDDALAISMQLLSDDTSMTYPFWTLYCLSPSEVEFWQADRERKHTRLLYSLEDSKWKMTLRWP